MSDELFFIPILARALEHRDRPAALRAAFREIAQRGRAATDARGYEQFLVFMDNVQAARTEYDTLRRLDEYDEITHAAFDGAGHPAEAERVGRELLHTSEQLDAYTRLFEELSELDDGESVAYVEVRRDGESIDVVRLERGRTTSCSTGVVPGSYEIRLDSGRLLWHGALRAQDCVWRDAFPGEPFHMAADTPEADHRPAQQFILMNGEVTIRVYPGLEAGHLELGWQPPEGAPGT